MASVQIEIPPPCEPVSLDALKNYLRVSINDDDGLIASLGISAREYCEEFTSRKFINTGIKQCLDSFPYYTDTIVSQMAYPPSYYSLPRYSTTLWNYSQMIKLFYSKLAAVTSIRYVGSDTKNWETLAGTTDVSNSGGAGSAQFLGDIESEPPRLFPPAGQFWPSVLYVPNAVELHYLVGYNDDAAIAAALAGLNPPIAPATSPNNCQPEEVALRQADVPNRIKIAIMFLTAFYYEHRDEPNIDVPKAVERLLWSFRVLDFASTRG